MKKIFFLLALMFITLSVMAQTADNNSNSETISKSRKFRYCYSYEDFLKDKWYRLDTLIVKTHTKKTQKMLGGNDYAFFSNEERIDKILRNTAFAVMIGDSLYLNCNKLRLERSYFGQGYTKARRVGNHSLLFVNSLIGKKYNNQVQAAALSGLMFGVFGVLAVGIPTANYSTNHQVCYILSNGANEYGFTDIRVVDDYMMEKILTDHKDQHDKYFSEQDEKQRPLAKRVIPILEQIGFFTQPEDEKASEDSYSWE